MRGTALPTLIVLLLPAVVVAQPSTRVVAGGVYPVTNDGATPDGVEQAAYPMPYADVDDGEALRYADGAGEVLACLPGDVTSTLDGRYVLINDLCGPILLTSSGDLDFGTSAGTDCATPTVEGTAVGGDGNTHASRSGFYELNRIREQAVGQLPDNAWLQQKLTANMNINDTCNAFWNGTVNFYRSGGGCSNTGEIAGVFDHEWGHGLDANDATPGISSPSGEGIADIYMALRLNTSCIGRNFQPVVCPGFGDPCLSCTGVRDIDYLKRQSGQPHTYSWSEAHCGGSVHCAGATYAEAIWSLWKRELQSPPYDYDDPTAQEIVTRLVYLGAGATGTWFSGSPPDGGCAASSGYMNFLAADDDNGDLNDGTPHMTAIYNAFNAQEIACPTPTVQDSGCPGRPTAAPANVTAVPLDRGVSLQWDAVAGATWYKVFRTEGVGGCDLGKQLLGTTSGTAFTETGLRNGRPYSYVVLPGNGSASCPGPASACVQVTPAGAPNLAIDGASGKLVISTGDGDASLDNSETAIFTFEVANVGSGALTNARIAAVSSPSHPSLDGRFSYGGIAASLADCGVGEAAITFQAAGLAFGDILLLDVDVTADNLSGGGVRSATFTIEPLETDYQATASKTWSFETGLEGWELVQGTFDRVGGGAANATDTALVSSNGESNQCDRIRSPEVVLTPSSTLSLWNNYEVEGGYYTGADLLWYDRANVGLAHDGGTRTVVEPDGGRLYNTGTTGSYSGCNDGAGGWAASAPTWAESTWSAAALGAAVQLVRLDVVYATDAALEERGFSFDEVTLTNFQLAVPDVQPDDDWPIFSDGFESGDVRAWTSDFFQPLFSDGFESGDPSAWSTYVP